MTLITWQDGGPLFKDGKVGTEQGCCCGCDCGSCSLTVKVDGVPVVTSQLGTTNIGDCVFDYYGNFIPFYCDMYWSGSQVLTQVRVDCAPDNTTRCEEVFAANPDSCPQGTQQSWETLSTYCELKCAACLFCNNGQVTVRVAFFFYLDYECRACDGSAGIGGFGKSWYRDYALSSLPGCEFESEMIPIGEKVSFDVRADCYGDTDQIFPYIGTDFDAMVCSCSDPVVSLSCANPLP